MISNEEFYARKKVLVTGGAGCIGSHLAQRLSSLEAEVTILDNLMRHDEAVRNLEEIKIKDFLNVDILNNNILSYLIKDGYEMIFHLAALPSHRLALERPRDYALTDIMGTVNILESARLSKKKPTVIFASSNKVYGKQEPPFREDKSCLPEGPYGQAKLCSEEWCMQYSKYYGLNTPIVRYHHVLGPRTQPDREISIFTERILNRESPIVHGKFIDGKFVSCSADYTDVNDAVEGTLLAGQIKGFDTFNLATGIQTPVEEIARLVMDYTGNQSEIIHKEMLSHETLVHLSDISKAKKILGFNPTRTVQDSVRDYINWRMKVGPRELAIYK